MYAEFQTGRKKVIVNIGAIGHSSLAKEVLKAEIQSTGERRNKSDRKRNRKDRWK